MPVWDRFLDEDLDIPKFEKFDRTKKIERIIIKEVEDKDQIRQKEMVRDEKRATKRGDEVQSS